MTKILLNIAINFSNLETLQKFYEDFILKKKFSLKCSEKHLMGTVFKKQSVAAGKSRLTTKN